MNRNKPKILLVEDEPSVATLFQFNLKKANYEVTLASNGEEGLKLAKTEKFDLILSDIMMPVLDGYQFRKQLLGDEILRNIPFVYLTAKGSEEDILSGYDLEIDEYIIKTSPPKIVIAKLNAILSSKIKRKKEAVDELNEAVNNLGSRVVPDKTPQLKDYVISQWHQPYEDIPGGDFIDYINLDQNKTIIIIGDVMGKKWNAWYFALAYAGYIRSAIRTVAEDSASLSPGKILEKVNKVVYNDERIAEIFTTISILLINTENNKILYSGAGDLPLFVVRKNNMVEQIQSEGLLLGFSESCGYKDVEIKLEKSETIYLITDGIIETENSETGFFGIDYFCETIKNSGFDINFKDLKKTLSRFCDAGYSDDISIVAIKKTG